MTISIITVAYHSEKVMPYFLASIERIRSMTDEKIELLIRDNTDDNIGLSRAVNLLLGKAAGELILFSNPDVTFGTSFFDMVSLVRQTGMPATPAYIRHDVDRRMPTFTRIVFASTITAGFMKRRGLNPIERDYDRVGQVVEQPGGSFLLMPRTTVNLLAEYGMFYDERFPVFYNDVDLAMRARQKGVRFLKASKCRVYHKGAHSTEDMDTERRLQLIYGPCGLAGFAKKWREMHLNILRLFFFLDAVLWTLIGLVAFFVGRRSRFNTRILRNSQRGLVTFRCLIQ